MDILVYLDTDGNPKKIGTLRQTLSPGKEVFSFRYDPNWLESGQFRSLDPDIAAFQGEQFLYDGKPNFGMFLDSSPDRWGRTLIKRREAILARSENRPPRKLRETDYLLGVYDPCRMGALRFKLNPEGPFLDNSPTFPAPPWSRVQELEQASLALEKDDIQDDSEVSKWLQMLFAPGSSLGGARPKANILDRDGSLWIAKFPSRGDTVDKGAWEMVANELAKQCRIHIPNIMCTRFSSRHHTFLTKRFDRTTSGRRIHFTSAMTFLGSADGADSLSGASYLQLVEVLMKNGEQVNEDLKELWKRIVFNISISNCDDHLGNHGFLLGEHGWRLSPVFDINPDPDGTGLKLNINEDDNSLDFDLALQVASYFRLSGQEAERILSEIRQKVSGWRTVADRYGISRLEQEQMSSAFNY